MDDWFVWVLGLYGIGVLLGLTTRRKALNITGYICLFIVLLSFPFIMILIDAAGAVGISGGLGGAGIALIGVVVAIFLLPAIGFLIGWFAKLFLPKAVNFFSSLNYTLMAIVIFGPMASLYYVSELQPKIKRKSELNFVQNTEVPVKFGDKVLVLPIRKDVQFGYVSLKELKMKMQDGPVKTDRIVIGGYNSYYNGFRPQESSKSSKNTPMDCLRSDNGDLFRCNFAKPDFTLTFREASRNASSEFYTAKDTIRAVDEFDIIKENWRGPKTEDEERKLYSFTLRDFSIDELDGLEVPNITECRRPAVTFYSCDATISSTNGKPYIKYKFTSKEVEDIPMIIRRTRSVANEYWTELLKNHGAKEMDVQ